MWWGLLPHLFCYKSSEAIMHTDYEDVLELPGGKEQTSYNLYWHARMIISGRWPEAEPTIMGNPWFAYRYAENVIGGRWPEAEPIIMKDPDSAFYYAQMVIHGRWPEAEPHIMKNSYWAYKYAFYVIQDRWPEAEPTIMEDPDKWRHYCKHFDISE